MIKQAKKASRIVGTSVKGVKGSCIISSLPCIDLSSCMIPEYMHSVLLGIVRQFLMLWVDKKGKEFSLNAFIDDIDTDLLNIKPPDDIHVLPRSIKLHGKHFKASEFYYWLIFYSVPILHQYLPENYFNHWAGLVETIYILLEKNIKKVNIDKAENLLKYFVRKIETLYDQKQLTYNVHQLLHLAECVRRWGPLWANSAFVFENMNGRISSLVHGTKHLGIEIMRNINIGLATKILKSHILKRGMKENQNKYSMLGAKVTQNLIKKIIDLKMRNSINNYSQKGSVDISELEFYYRAKIFDKLFTSEVYKETTTNSFKVEISTIDEKYDHLIGSIICFFKFNKISYLMLRPMSVSHDEMFFNNDTRTGIRHILPVREDILENFFIIRLEKIKSIGKLFNVFDKFLCRRPNYIISTVI